MTGRCRCGHPLYDHGRLGKDGNQVWVGCRACDGCEAFRDADGSAWPTDYAGATLGDPTDLDVNSDHWVDGEVVLATEPAA